MQFINILMLFGLLAVAIPIVIQLLTRKNVRRIVWGAWMFLDLTMKKRRRKVLLEDILLLACRCLALGLAALAFARPFVRPDSPVPWSVTMPVLLLAITAVGVSFALWRYPKPRKLLFCGGLALLALAIATVVFERQLNLKRFGSGANKDVVLVIDGSASMSIVCDGKSNFERAVEEAKKYVELSPRNTSFAVIAGGPVPQVMNPVPIADRRIVMNTLDALHPVNGTMRIGPNLTAAAVTLAAGQNAVKQIVIVGDGQAVGWDLGDAARWKNLCSAFAALKTQPIVTWRTLPLPSSIRNLAIESVRPARSIVGTDRPVSFAVTLVNAGTEAVTPKGLVLTAEGHEYRAPSVGQLEAGESRVFRFSHTFKSAGGTVVTARVRAEDDLPADDVYEYAMPVIGSMKVLVVDGGSGRPTDRAATYLSLALRPEVVAAAGTDEASAERRDFLVATQVEDAATAAQRMSFAGYSAVVLAGVRRLSEQSRTALARFVESGGGLLVLPQMATDADDFNGWTFRGAPVLPAPLGKWRDNPSAIDPLSFGEMLARFRTGTDLASATPEQVMDFGEGWTSNACTIARLADESPLLLRHAFGRGAVILAATDFGPRSGLVAKRGFLPLVHELAYALAQPSSVTLDVRPSESLSLLVASGSLGGEAVPGIHPEKELKGKPLGQVDSQLDRKLVKVEDPHGEVFYAEICGTDEGLVLRVTRPVVPGVYQVSEIPESVANALGSGIGSDGKLRFSVSSGVEESTLTAVTQSDLSKLASYVQISQAIKDEDVIKSIGGESFGKEVWRVLAIAAFLFLVLEPFIARWIAINRRTGDLIDTEGSWIRT